MSFLPSSPPPSPAPEPLGVPAFAPLRVRGGAQRLRRALWRQRRTMAAGLAVTAAALAASTARGTDATGPAHGRPADNGPGAAVPVAAAPAHERRPAAALVSAPVRIADAATVRLLRPGDHVDVIAAPDPAVGEAPEARVVASGVRVAEVPDADEGSSEDGALVVLSVPRATAAELAGAGATSRLAVTVC
ncbi:RcpC/CpaB family pilus assembly protein [Streptomyces sp. NPDC003023]|uniref:RcpC/CpaB family pilus assembly protein n=1 Tax=Streptomyces sp. NPDC003023 TaxID=3364675 RepID=UPI00369FEF14